jgi:hypothetical protein
MLRKYPAFYLPVFLCAIFFLGACQKGVSDELGTASKVLQYFEVKVNGQLTTFRVTTSFLVRSVADNQRRIDLGGISTDSLQRLTLSIVEPLSTGTTIPARTYTIRMYNLDDPATGPDESINSKDGYTTYGTRLNSADIFTTDIFMENGTITVTSCDDATKTISGTFSIQEKSLAGPSLVNFTEGKFTNIRYTLFN